MVAVTRKGVRKTPRRSTAAPHTTSRGSGRRGKGAATIAPPLAVKLEEIPYDTKKHVYHPTPDQYIGLIEQGWTPVSAVFDAAARTVYREEDPDDPEAVFELQDISLFTRYVVLQRRRRFGTREYVDEILVEMPVREAMSRAGWSWYSEMTLSASGP